jgi:membrane associated rhomboid family serine protease
MILALFVWSALEVFGVFFPQGNIASSAHLFGIVAGVSFALYMRWQHNRKPRLFFEDL